MKQTNSLSTFSSHCTKLRQCFFFFCLWNNKTQSADLTEKQYIDTEEMQTHTPPGRRPRAWPAWPAAGRTRPARRWGSWWWSAERAPATPPRTPARYRTPRRRSGAPAAPRRSCREERRWEESWCSWRTSVRARRKRRRWGRIWGSMKDRGWQGRRNCAEGRREGRREGRLRLTRWVKSWSCSSGHGRAENWWHK